MNTEARLNALEQSLERAQSSLRRTRFALGACVLAALAGLVMAAARDNGVLSAREFVVVDGQGHALARLGASNGGGGLALLDRAGHARVVLDNTPQGPLLHLDDANGKSRATLAALNVGPVLAFRDADGHLRLATGDVHDAPNLSVFDESGRVVWKTR